MMKVRAIAEIWDRVAGKPVQAVAQLDMREESREQLINSILENARAVEQDAQETAGNDGNGSKTIQ
jgi:hypothetical protein